MIPRSVLALTLLLLSGCGYNRIQDLDERVTAARANIDAELRRRNDLIPNLVATVDEAAAFERETFTEVARARSGVTQARDRVEQAVRSGADADEVARANAELTDNLRGFLTVSVEAYPMLSANRSFIALQDELTETENRIVVARRDYNEAVQTYNTYIRQFPQVITARVIGARRKEPFRAPSGVEQPPPVQFRPESAPSP